MPYADASALDVRNKPTSNSTPRSSASPKHPRVYPKSRLCLCSAGWWENVREKLRLEMGVPRMDRVVNDPRCRPYRDFSATGQQWLKRRHDRHGFKSRAAYQARRHAGASLCGCEPMPVQYRPDHLAERALGPKPSSRDIGLFRRESVLRRQRLGCASSPALALLPQRDGAKRSSSAPTAGAGPYAMIG